MSEDRHQPQENPYASPREHAQLESPNEDPLYLANRARTLERLKGPATSYMVLAVLGLMNLISGFISRFARGQINVDFQDPEFIGRIVALMVIGSAHVAAFFIGVNMQRGERYWACRIVSISMCVPCLTPCVVLGIPFGIWGLITLGQTDVRQAFKS